MLFTLVYGSTSDPKTLDVNEVNV